MPSTKKNPNIYDKPSNITFSIRTKVTLILILIFSLIFLGTYWSYKRSAESLESQIFNQLITANTSINEHIETYLGELAGKTQILARDPFIKNAIENEEFDGVTAYLKEVSEVDKNIAHIDLIDVDGVVQSSSLDSKIGGDKSEHPAYLEGMKGTYYRELHMSSSSSKPAFGVSVPIINNDKFIGVMFMDMEANKLYEILNEKIGGGNGETYLTNKDFLMVSPSIYRDDVFLKEKISTENATKCKHDHRDHSPDEFKQASIYSNYAGVNVVGTHSYLENTKWCVLLELDKNKTLIEPLRAVIISGLSQGLIALVSLVALWLFLTKNISNPISKIREKIQDMEKGNYDLNIKIYSNDEIGHLAKAFNNMASTIVGRTKKIKEDQAQLLASIRDLPIGFAMVNNQHNIILSNKTMKTIFNIKSDNFTLEDIDQKLGSKLELVKLCRESIETKKTIQIQEFQFSESKIVKVFIIPIISMGEKEENIGTVILISDITEEKLLSRTRDEFFAVAAHELRTPLTVIHGNSSLIQEYFEKKVDDTSMKTMLSDINSSSKLLISIVEDFLNVSLLEQKQVEFKKEEFEVSPLITEAIKELSKVAKNKKITIKLEESKEKLPLAKADKIRTKHIILNLLENGLKFTQKGGVVVKVYGENNVLKVSISDTGVGIPKENQKMLFRKFTQTGSDPLRRDATQGTGLGLYIAKLSAEGMKGSVALISSEPGKGSTFELTLPAVKK